MKIDVSVIAAFYNKFDFLRLTLAGFARQRESNFELVIADDGSDKQVVSSLQEEIQRCPFPVQHVWHEDVGWRKNVILNKALQSAKGDYIIIIDADCVPHSCFVKDHYNSAREGTVLAGRRVHLSEKMTGRLTPELVRSGYLENHKMALFYDSLFGDSYDVEKGWRITFGPAQRFINRKKRGILGSNFSAWKRDFMEINGFDERYTAASVGEDTDIQYRFELAGKDVRPVKNIAVQYHLHHKMLHHPKENLSLFEKVKIENRPYTPYGIKKEMNQSL